MPGPWEDYAPAAPAAGHGPWEDYGSAPLPPVSQHVQGHPLKGQNFGDWLSEELLQPVVNAATQLGKGIQGLGHPEQRPLTESVKDVVQGGMAITTPFVMGGLNNEPAPAGAPSAGAPSAVGTALKGGAMGALKAIPKAAETSILRYTGVPQLARGAYQGAKEALAARAESMASPAATPPGAAETLADGTTVNDILKGGGVKEPGKATPEQLAGARATFDKLKAAEQGQAAAAGAPSAYTPRPPEYYGVKAAGTPPNPPTQSAASAQPVPAAAPAPTRPAAPQPGEPGDIDFQQRYGEYEQPEVAKFLGHSAPPGPKPASTAASVARTANAQAKAERFVEAIQRYNRDFPNRQPITSDSIAAIGDEGKSIITQALKSGGYLKNTERFTDTSFPYILQGLRNAEAASKTIRPQPGFSMGAMRQ